MRIPGFLFLSSVLLSSSAYAQDVNEAFKLSNLNTQGTARSMGFGNALGSVGGDFSTLSVNPAGLGIYRSSEMSFTPALKINGATGDYAGTSTSDNNTRFGINQFAIVLTNAPKGKRYDRRNWKAVSFAFGMNRVADFNHDYTYTGKNTTSSATQAFESDANQYPSDATSAGPSNALGYIGWQSYLLDTTMGSFFKSVVPFGGGINQLKTIHERGSINEYVFSLGGNYKEKLMLGATIGIPSLNYTRDYYYTESLAPGNPGDGYGFNRFSYGQALHITGNGVNLKLGAIYKFSNLFRAGIALHTPTWYSITDDFDPSVSSTSMGYTTVLTTSDALNHNQFDYRVSTPWKAVLSATIMLNNMGFITVDYEYVDYSTTKYHFSQGIDANGMTFQEEADIINSDIKKTYKGASNFRLGGEARIGKYFMARAGFGYYGDPYTSYGKSVSPVSYTTQRIDLSTGAGFRFDHFFADLGFVHSMYQGYEQPYGINYGYVVSGPAAIVPTAKMNYSLNDVALTVGVKF